MKYGIWLVGSLLKTKIDSIPIYNKKYIKTKIKIHKDKVYTNFENNKIPKDNEYFTCFFVILVDSILVNSDKKYYPQIFLKECKCAMKVKKIANTYKDLELSESDDDEC